MGEHVGLGVVGDAGAGEVAAVVGRVAVVEAIGDGEVEDLVRERVAQCRAHQRLVTRLEAAATAA